MKTCSIEGCNKKIYAKGLCKSHYLSKYSKEKIEMCKKHFKYLLEFKKEKVAILEMRTHAAWYIKSMKNEQEYTILFVFSDIFMQNQIHLCNLGADYFR